MLGLESKNLGKAFLREVFLVSTQGVGRAFVDELALKAHVAVLGSFRLVLLRCSCRVLRVSTFRFLVLTVFMVASVRVYNLSLNAKVIEVKFLAI